MNKQAPNPVRLSNPHDPVYAYLKDIRFTKKLSSEEEKRLAKSIRLGDKQALRTLIEANLKFVVAVCRKYENRGMSLGDLINEGNLGLIHAAQRFDDNANCRFISYAVWWIRQAILGALAGQARSVTLSPFTIALISKINKAREHLGQKLDRNPTLEELELETGLHADRIRHCLGLIDGDVPFDNVPWFEDGDEEKENWPDNSDSSSQKLREQFHARLALEKLMNKLAKREREVLMLYYGIETGAAWSLGDLAHKYGLTREGVRHIKKRALGKIQTLLKRSEKK